MKIRIDPADRIYSKYIRKRDGECVRCHSKVEFNDKGDPISHQCSHYFSRGKESVRFNDDNCDTLCWACHNLWGHGDERDEYKAFKIKQLGEEGFKRLRAMSEMFQKRDRKMALIIAKKLYEQVLIK